MIYEFSDLNLKNEKGKKEKGRIKKTKANGKRTFAVSGKGVE